MRLTIALVATAVLLGSAVSQQCTSAARSDRRCGSRFANASCASSNECCSQDGFCGTSAAECNSKSLCPAQGSWWTSVGRLLHQWFIGDDSPQQKQQQRKQPQRTAAPQPSNRTHQQVTIRQSSTTRAPLNTATTKTNPVRHQTQSAAPQRSPTLSQRPTTSSATSSANKTSNAARVAAMDAIPGQSSCINTPRLDGRCGLEFGRARCGPGLCCSHAGWCGSTPGHCSSTSQCPMSTENPARDCIALPRIDGRCGPLFGNSGCPSSLCCSHNSWCGTTSDHCNAKSICTFSSFKASNPPASDLPPRNGLVQSAFNWCGRQKLIALSFDDGPIIEPKSTEVLLDDLRHLNIKATFFLAPLSTGKLSSRQCQLLQTMLNDGHAVHCHSMTHQDFNELSFDEIRRELAQWVQWYDSCGVSENNPQQRWLFRPPYGNLTPDRAKYINGLGFTVATWNVDSLDWQGGNAASVFQRTISTWENSAAAGGSALILHHDAHYVPGGTRGILEMYQKYFQDLRGYRFVTADQCLAACTKDSTCKLENSWPGVFDGR